MTKKQLLFFVLGSGTFFFLRFHDISYWLTASSDQGAHILAIYDIVVNRHLTLLGPPSSFTVLSGREFFFGPLPFYLTVPFIWIFGFNQMAISLSEIILQYFGLAVLVFVLIKKYPGRIFPYFFAVLVTFSPTFIHYSQFLWNCNPLLPITFLIIANFVMIRSRATWYWFLSLGVLSGFAMQTHYGFVLAIPVMLLAVKKQISRKNILFAFGGFLVGFAPLIIFDLKHNFYNLTTMYFYVLTFFHTGQAKMGIKTIPLHYFFSILPYLFLAAAVLLEKFKKVGLVLLVVFIGYGLAATFPRPSHGFLMPEGLNYLSYAQMRDIILSQNPKDYNLIDFETGDTRALYLRALLTISGKAPLGFADYPIAKTTFIYTRLPIGQVLGNGLWEIEASLPGKVTGKWPVGGGIYIYRVDKTSSLMTPPGK